MFKSDHAFESLFGLQVSIQPYLSMENLTRPDRIKKTKYLRGNSRVRDSVPELGDFYDSMSGTEEIAFFEVEGLLYQGDFSGARTLLDEIEPDEGNNVGQNYEAFYSLYASYIEAVDASTVFSSSDSTDLYALAHLCPGVEGACIYQARALYELLYPGIAMYLDDCEEEGARAALQSNQAKSFQPDVSEELLRNIKLYPNPAGDIFYLISESDVSEIAVEIYDMTGRSMNYKREQKSVKVLKIQSELSNGVYQVILSTRMNQRKVVKLIIQK